MSKLGIQIASEVFTFMQQKRHELMSIGCINPKLPEYKQDILLSKLFERANDLIKDDFISIIDGKYPESGHQIKGL